MLRSRLATKYIFFEMLPSFVLGVLVFEIIILMFQSIRLTELMVVHGADLNTVLLLVSNMATSFLPIILPMSLIFAVLLTYGRLSADSEIVALRSLGLSLTHLLVPATLLAGMTAVLSAYTSFELAPWGNFKMELMLHEMAQSKPQMSIRSGVFSEGFFDLVVYANEVNNDTGELKHIFIYDERKNNQDVTIVAKNGILISEDAEKGQKAFLRLFDGNIHRTGRGAYTKIDFQTYDINLFDQVKRTERTKTVISMSVTEIEAELARTDISEKERRTYLTDLYRRYAISFACLIFGWLGVGLGTTANRRAQKSNGFVLSIIVIVVYWILYASFENLAKNGTVPPLIGVWTPNFIGMIATGYFLRKT